MAWLERRGDLYRLKFRYGGREHAQSLKTGDRREAQALMGKLEENLILLERGKLEVPPGADLGLFLLSDGKLHQSPTLAHAPTLGQLFAKYREAGYCGKEKNTRDTEEVHMGHLERLLGARRNVQGVMVEVLQGYVNERAKDDGMRGKVSHKTIQKEVGTFAAIWNRFGVPQGLVKGPAPTKGLVYHKTRTKAPFQTWEQIERRVKRGGLSVDEQTELWESLLLSTAQVEELLKQIKDNAKSKWLYPMACFAAYTGARRSEIMRSEVDDVDFDGKTVRVREKKKDQRKELTFRHVPLSPALAAVLKEWLVEHPGGRLTVCRDPDVEVTDSMADHHFFVAVSGSTWDVVRGYHTLRHSFCSNCAAAGIDQRMISAWVGHMTPEMEARYRHLFPHQEQEALAKVFG